MSKLIQGRARTAQASNIPKLHDLDPPTRLPDYITETGSTRTRGSASDTADDVLNVDDVGTKKHLAAEIANALINVGIIPWPLHTTFDLEHLSNLICITDGLHALYDKYGIYAYLPSSAIMDELITILETRNEAWQTRLDNINPSLEGKNCNLIGLINEDLWSRFTYEIAILLPDYFLPSQQELLIRDPSMPHVSYFRTKIIEKELRVIPTQPDAEPIIYPPCFHSTQHCESERINPFFLCLHAVDKYEFHCRKYGIGMMSPRVDALFQKATKIMDLVFTKLEPSPNSRGAKYKAQSELEEAKEIERKRRRESEDTKQGMCDGGEAVKGNDEASWAASADGPAAYWDAITKELEQDDLSPRERSVLNLECIFLGRDYETPHIPGVPDPPSVFDCISRGDYIPYESGSEIAGSFL
ncbi:hypothetical protein BDP27DRAFT_1432006 [Rhodocollybia butyracea]|uniref:Uncharacterized protein n=1 Tax=Rhodocollybia butyracea TaxID=206335 RepID=A0A9P5TX06_9AGAR|nr:hypothetical protein BDP27DRAFT_1432006 [Rhodocollybia butyracea]